MKTNLVFISLWAILVIPALAQSSDNKLSIEVSGGIMQNGLYNPPHYWIQCIEGCFPESQTSFTGHTFAGRLHRNINQKHSIYMGASLQRIGYNETGTASDGANWFIYNQAIRWTVMGIVLGYRHQVLAIRKLRFFWDTGIQGDIETGQDYSESLRPVALSANGQLGVRYPFARRISITGGPFFKTAILRYNNRPAIPTYSEYLPFAWGMTAGLQVSL